MIRAVVLFAVGLILLIKGGDWFVDGATGIARRFRVPELLTGATIVSIGTTLPEVMVSATSATKGFGEIAYGNAIGSIICNTALIAALTIAVKPVSVDKKALETPVMFFFVTTAFYAFTAYFFGEFSRLTGIILLCIFVLYMVLTVMQALRTKTPVLQENIEAETADKEKTAGSFFKDIVLLVAGAAFIAVGADFIVDNGTVIAKGLGVPDSVIALTFVALGTSLPELVTAITSLIKGHGALSLGNIVGANLFNLVLVSGLSSAISPFSVPASNTIMGYNTSLLVEIPLMFFVMAFLTIPALIRGKLSRAQGIILLIVYSAFCVFQFAV